VVTAVSNFEGKFAVEQQKIDQLSQPEEKEKAQLDLDVRRAILDTLPALNRQVKNVNELRNDDIKQIVVDNIKREI